MQAPEPKYGAVDLISIEQIVSRTKVRLNIQEISDFDDEIEMYINEAAVTLGTKPTFRLKNCRIAIDECAKGTLPNGFKKFHGVRMVYEPNVQQTTTIPFFPLDNCGDMLYLEQPYFQQCENQNCQPILGSIQIIGNKIQFPIPNPFTHAVISYDGYAVGCDGILEMHPAYERGFSEYARAMTLDTYNYLYKGEPAMLRETINRSFQIWATEYHALTSDAFSDDFQVNNYMVKRILGALLQSQNSVTT